MVAQLVNSALSFATMLEEARGAESHADFTSKCAISLKECRESWTRVRVCFACQIGHRDEARALVEEANELVSIMTRIAANARRNQIRRKRAAKDTPARSDDYHVPNS